MTTLAGGPLERPALPDSAADAVYRKVALRLIPLLFLCYIAAYLDRVNVSFAKLQMQQALQLSESVYGLGSGIFFIGYFIFEIPSNVMLHKVGAGRWIARIMVTWAVLSAAMMFVNSALSFYIVRFLLGVAEAGFFPGIILYLTYWFPAARRGRATSLFLTAIAVAGLIGNPISGWIMHSLSGVNGWQGWQWLFVLEALPSLVLGVLAWFLLEDRVKNAQWLTQQERDLIARDIAAEESRKSDGGLALVLSDGKVWLLAFVYFAIVSGLYGVTFWLPTIIKELGVPDPLQVGLIGAVPWAFGIAAMYLMARSADRRHEYRWHTAVSCVVSAAGLVISVAFHADAMLAMAGLTIAAMGIMSALPIFWSNPTALLGGTAAAMGIAFINSVGNLAGFAIPLIIGVIKDKTHSTDAGLHMLAALMLLGAIVVLVLRRPAAR
ncbi:MAG: MFS transporter [Vitreoscilla sp.]